MGDVVTLAISLPLNGTAADYRRAVSAAICENSGSPMAQMALSSLLGALVPDPSVHQESGAMTLVYGRMP